MADIAKFPPHAEIEDFPRVGFYNGTGSPEDDPLPSCIRAFCEYRNENADLRDGDDWHALHLYAMGITGGAFRLLFDPKERSYATMNVLTAAGDPRDPIRDAFAAIGYDCEILLRKSTEAEWAVTMNDPGDETIRRRILESINAGLPVLSIGLIGPPEAGWITGYEEGGDVLIGQDFFQSFPEYQRDVVVDPSGVYRKRNWLSTLKGIVLVGEKTGRPPLRTVFREALSRGLRLMRAPVAGGFASGQAAYTAWADSLMSAADLPDEPEMLREKHNYHWHMVGTLAEARAWGSGFLRMAAKYVPEAADDLNAAAECFDDQHDLMWAVWEFTRGEGPEGRVDAKFKSDYTRRRRIVPLLRMARRRDAGAAGHIEKALAVMSAYPERMVLENVPKIDFGVHCSPFPGTLKAIMENRGRSCDYDALMAVTGAAFRRLWNRDDGGNIDLMYFAPEPVERAFRWLNTGYRAVPPDDRAGILRAMKESISRGWPAMSFGIVGPPEAGLTIGYDRGGDVMIGSSYFQEGHLPDAFEKERWFEEMSRGAYGLLVVEDEGIYPHHTERGILVSTLEWAIRLARTPSFKGTHAQGLAAYDAWADALEVDADYPAGDSQVLETRVMVHGDQTLMLGERQHAVNYLRKAAEVAPEAADALNAAADRYEAVAKKEEGIWPWGHDMGPETQRGLADPARRREIARHVRDARENEAVAVESLEKALDLLKG